MNYVHEFYERMVELGFNPELGVTIFISVLSAFFCISLLFILVFFDKKYASFDNKIDCINVG
jgi:hypothetical protein